MTELEIADAAISADRNLLAVWERWWTALDGTPGEIVWDADAGDLAADLEQFAASFDERLPEVDFGCGDGRQTRFLARHFTTVLGIDISPAAIDPRTCRGEPPKRQLSRPGRPRSRRGGQAAP
jgi:SAM-dependent methyltransferase